MKLSGATVLHKSLLLGLSVMYLHTACSNSNFRAAPGQTATEEPAPSGDAEALPSEDPGITTTSIGTSDLEIPAAIKPAPDSLFAQFPTSLLKNAETRFTLDLKDVSTKISLKNDVSNKTENFRQNTRTQVDEAFKQGNTGIAKTNEFLQAGKKGLVDILVVIDNSGSMDKEQTNLSTKLDALLGAIKDADWQISVINTNTAINGDPTNPSPANAATEGMETCFSTLIKKSDATAAADFAKAIQAGTSGSGYEQGIRQAVVGLRCPGKNVVRAGSTVAVLIVSDEDNCSLDGFDCKTAPWAKETYLISYVENTLKRTVGTNAGFYGIIAPSKALCSTAGNPAPQYIRLFDYKAPIAGANYGNICDANYSTTLNRISQNIALQLDSTFSLSDTPDAGSLIVTVKSTAGVVSTINPGDYTLTDKTLKFTDGKEPANGSIIAANYRINAVPMFNAVTLNNDPATGTIDVAVNGTPLALGSFSSTGRTINFATTPPANADIRVSYRLNMPLANSFQLAGTPIGGTVTVKVKNVATNAFSYDAVAKKVNLATFPLDAEAIDISYDSINGPQLVYGVSISSSAKNFRLLDGATALAFTLDEVAGKITINAANHQLGKELTFTYELPDGAARRFPLVAQPEPGTLNVNTTAGTCIFGKDLRVVGMELIATCPVTEKSEFVLSYKYLVLQKTFTLSGITNPEQGVWKVYYKGEVTSAYTRSGATITLNEDPEPSAAVNILYTFPE